MVLKRDMDKTEQILAKSHVFRNNIQSFLFEKAVNEFMENYESIMCGEYQGDLLKTKEDEFIGALKKVTSDNCFSCREVLLLEIGGYNVVKELLDIFYDCIGKLEEANIDDTKEYEGKIYRMISGNYKYIMLHDYENNGKKNFDKLTAYDKLHLIVDFVSGMTDSYAVSLHKKLTGNSLTE